MSPRPTARRRLAGSGGALAALLLSAPLAAACVAEAGQPIAYNHQLHVKKLEMGCEFCHESSRQGEVAGLPGLAICSTCHQEANGTSPRERAVVEAVQAGSEIPWRRISQLPRHVWFTHRRHVGLAGIACDRCHGDMGAQSAPPTRPLVALTMALCLECHRERGASQDCDACHR